MKIFAFLLLLGPSLLAAPSAAFSPATARRSTAASSTSLRSIIFEPPVEENCEVDGSDCEESIFAIKRRERAAADDAIRERYRVERGIELTKVDLMESIDQYQNAPLGANLIPGLSLSALCEDD